MVVGTKLKAARPQSIEIYLGFKIVQHSEDGFAATPMDWSHTITVLEASDLPTLRKRIWSWWHPAD